MTAQRPAIVVLDAHPLDADGLEWSALRELGTCTIHAHTTPDQVAARIAAADVVLTNKVVLRETAFAAAPRLRYVGVLATGYNVVDVAAAQPRGIVATNVPEYGTRTVAQHVFALLLALTNHVGTQAAGVAQGEWERRGVWTYWDRPPLELAGTTLGIVGLGRIGRAVAELGTAFGMRVVAHRPSRTDGPTLREVLEQSDVVSLHCPLTPETENLIDAEALGWMRPQALLLNTSRGRLLDEAAVAAALNEGRLGGAGLDVLSVEPPKDNPLVGAANCLITPHVAWASRAARQRLMATAIANVAAFLAGRPANVVSG